MSGCSQGEGDGCLSAEAVDGGAGYEDLEISVLTVGIKGGKARALTCFASY